MQYLALVDFMFDFILYGKQRWRIFWSLQRIRDRLEVVHSFQFIYCLFENHRDNLFFRTLNLTSQNNKMKAGNKISLYSHGGRKLRFTF